MRTFISGLIVLCFAGVTAGADDKLTAKTIVGKWSIKPVGIKVDPRDAKSIELKADGTYVWTVGKSVTEGTYKLKGTTLEITLKNGKDKLNWDNLSMKNGKIIRAISKNIQDEWTRVDTDESAK